MKPICIQCRRFMRCKQNGYFFTEGMPKPGYGSAEPGDKEPEKWQPYKVWVGDLYECPDCAFQTIAGVPSLPASEHYKPDFDEWQARSNVQINDC